MDRPRLEQLGPPAALAVVVAAIYWPVGRHSFVHYDDPLYVFANPTVLAGLTADGVRWAFTTFHASNWHPITWLSHLLDVHLFGPAPGPHHAVSVALHALNAVVLYAWLRSATGAAVRSALAAALFAVHPLRVESVAWISERKDLLSTLFWLLTLAAYLRYVRRRGPARYALVALAFALGLMSKPMVVTLPIVLLLLDVWPLRRIGPGGSERYLPVLAEKLPLLAMSAAAAIVTIVAQTGASVVAVSRLSIADRLANAIVSVAGYLWRTIWPVDLAVLYPHPAWQPGGVPAWQVALSAVILAAVSGLAAWQWRRRSFIAVGWLWYLVTLVPVIGIVQAGVQSMADRYTYLPLVGVAIAVVWSLPDLGRASIAPRVAAGAGAGALLAALAIAARGQALLWRDTRTLFEHTVAVTRHNWQAWEILGNEYVRQERLDLAMKAYEEALAARAAEPDHWKHLAEAQAAAGNHAAAAESLERQVQARPGDVDAWYALGVAYFQLGHPQRLPELVERLRRIDPGKAQELHRRFSGER